MAAAVASERPSRAQRAAAKRRERLRKMRAKSGNRYRIHYDIEGPRVRLGILWFVGAMASFAAGLPGVTLYFGVAFAAAASHTLRTWRARGAAVDPRAALGGVALVALAAAFGPQVAGVAVLAVTAGALVLAASELSGDEGAGRALAGAGLVLQATLPAATAVACLVLLADLESWAAIALILLVSSYETGDFLIGSGSANVVEGPLAGSAAVLVTALAVAAVGFPPFGVGEAVLFGVAVAPLAVLGQLVGSVMLPHARAFAPALRRVDSLLLAAPAWYVGVDALVL